MRKCSVFFLAIFGLALYYGNVIGQENFVNGPLLENKYSTVNDIVGEDQNSFYVFKVQATGEYDPAYEVFEKYSKATLQLEFSKKLEVPLREKNASLSWNFVRILFNKDHFHLFFTHQDKSTKNQNLFVQKYDLNANLIGTFQKIDHFFRDKDERNFDDYKDGKDWRHNNKVQGPGYFRVEQSEDKSKILIMNHGMHRGDDAEMISFKVFDSELNELGGKVAEFSFSDNAYNVDKFIISNEGIVAVQGVLLDKGEKKVSFWNHNFSHLVLLYDYKKNSVSEFKIEFENKFVSSVNFSFDKSGDLLCAGFYSNSDKIYVAQHGLFILKVNSKEKRIDQKRTNDFDEIFLREFMSESDAQKKEGLYEFKPSYFLNLENGEVLIAAEQNFYTFRETEQMTTFYEFRNNIIVFKVDAHGNIVWKKKINKRQKSVNDYGVYLSFDLFRSNGKINILFLDHPKNGTLDLYAPSVYKNFKEMNKRTKAVLVHYTLNESGEISRNLVGDFKRNQVVYKPYMNSMYRSDSNYYIAYGDFKNKYKFFKIGN